MGQGSSKSSQRGAFIRPGQAEEKEARVLENQFNSLCQKQESAEANWVHLQREEKNQVDKQINSVFIVEREQRTKEAFHQNIAQVSVEIKQKSRELQERLAFKQEKEEVLVKVQDELNSDANYQKNLQEQEEHGYLLDLQVAKNKRQIDKLQLLIEGIPSAEEMGALDRQASEADKSEIIGDILASVE